MSFGENLKNVRKQRGVTQEELAEILGVSRQAISKWESGTSVPDVQLLLRIADDLSNKSSVSIDDYLGRVCDVSMNSFRHSVIRNVKIVGAIKT